MKRVWPLVGGAAVLVLAGFIIYFKGNYSSILEIFNFLNPPSESPSTIAPQEPLELVGQEITVNGTKYSLNVPEGYKIEVFAAGFSRARFMAIDPDTNDLYLTEPNTGKVWNASKMQVVASGLNNPHGIAFFEGAMYVSGTTSVYRFRNGEKETLISNLPSGGHYTSTIVFGLDKKMYVSRGSSCNVCIDNPRRAAILRFDKDGKNEEIFASGLRNSVGLGFHPVTGELWATNNGRDYLGNNLPPEEVNIIKQNQHYGWPYCYGQNLPDPDFGSQGTCNDKTPPVVEMQAHSAPLGMRFSKDGSALLVAFHGSWNRSVPTGYKIVRIKAGPSGEDPRIADYVTGWRPTGQAPWGRPVDVIFDKDGNLYISDDLAGVIYRVTLNTN